MTEAIASVLGGRVLGAWLFGSVVLDDFRLGWSDIDMLVLTDGPISESEAEGLVMLRQKLAAREPENPYYRLFEGIVAYADEYRTGEFTRLVYWGTTGQRVTDRYRMDAFSRYELAKYGRRVFGSGEFDFEPPESRELYDAVAAHCRAIRECAVRTDESLYSCGWLLDIARCVYTLRRGGVIAKTAAGLWALEKHIFPDDEPLRKTLAIRQEPLLYKDRAEVKLWLSSLGPVVQSYADALELELGRYAE